LQQTGESLVDVDEPLEEPGFELRKIEAVVKDGPQYGVGVAKVVTGVFLSEIGAVAMLPLNSVPRPTWLPPPYGGSY
jgi:hypothetical protein